MKVKRLTTYELKKFLSKDKICIFINSDQLFWWIIEKTYKIKERLKITNNLLNLKPEKLELKDLDNFVRLNELFLILEFDNKEEASEMIVDLYRNLKFRENIYADLWINGKFIEENT